MVGDSLQHFTFALRADCVPYYFSFPFLPYLLGDRLFTSSCNSEKETSSLRCFCDVNDDWDGLNLQPKQCNQKLTCECKQVLRDDACNVCTSIGRNAEESRALTFQRKELFLLEPTLQPLLYEEKEKEEERKTAKAVKSSLH